MGDAGARKERKDKRKGEKNNGTRKRQSLKHGNKNGERNPIPETGERYLPERIKALICGVCGNDKSKTRRNKKGQIL